MKGMAPCCCLRHAVTEGKPELSWLPGPKLMELQVLQWLYFNGVCCTGSSSFRVHAVAHVVPIHRWILSLDAPVSVSHPTLPSLAVERVSFERTVVEYCMDYRSLATRSIEIANRNPSCLGLPELLCVQLCQPLASHLPPSQ